LGKLCLREEAADRKEEANLWLPLTRVYWL
jgi:hypothetical protein